MDQNAVGSQVVDSVEGNQSSKTQENSSTQSPSPASADPNLSTRSTPAISSSRSTPPAENSMQSTPNEEQNVDPEHTPSKRPGLRIRNTAVTCSTDPLEEAMKPLTEEELRNWKGWVELESEPELFNFILSKFGAKDLRVKEIIGLDDGLLASLPKPVYGMIFLYKYLEEEEEETSKCPNHVWFANQTITNACATIALLNIVMNIEEIDLGDELTTFKSETQHLKPAYRGKRLGENEFIRNIHNSFARRMDILNADLALQNEMDKWEKMRRGQKRKRTGAIPKKSKKDDEDEAAFHFIAYVPVKGEVWRLDGLERHPVSLGIYQEDWMVSARDNIQQHIDKYKGQEHNLFYNLLSICKSPLLTIPKTLAENIRSISAIEIALNNILPGWEGFLEQSEQDLETGPNDTYGITQGIFDNSAVRETSLKALEHTGTQLIDMLNLHKKWTQEQSRLKVEYIQEAAAIGRENEQAARRKYDYTPAIYNSIKTLAEEGVLKKIIEDNRGG